MSPAVAHVNPSVCKYDNHSQNRVHSVDDFVFDAWDERSAYLLGVLYAEGHVVTSKKCYRIALSVSSKDIEWLEMLQKAFDFKGKISSYNVVDQYKPRSAVRFGFSSKRIHRQLLVWGMKSWTPPPVPDEVFHHFVRGYFDGDGSVYYDTHTKSIKTSFVGPFGLMKSMKERIHNLVGTSNQMRVHPKSNSAVAFSICYGARDTERLARFMYHEATMCLQRKRLRFKN